jgi:MFS family permease
MENSDNSVHPEDETMRQNHEESPVMITANTSFDGYKLRNFYLTNGFQGFVWMIFHFSVVFFFTFQLQSVALVGIFLGIANAIAFCLDIPVGILQRYYSTKKLFIIAAISQLIAVGIFLGFIYNFSSLLDEARKFVIPDGFSSILGWFFSSGINLILIIIASICYGLAKEINDISTFGYILSHASPSEYGQILARNNITYGLGSLVGLVLSGIVLSFQPTLAVIILWGIIAGFLAFTYRFFDNSEETLVVDDVVSFTIAVSKLNKENIREYVSEKISAIDLAKILENTKYVFLKPRKKETRTFEWKELVLETKKTTWIILSILKHSPPYILIYWTISLVLIFGFWDTFATTFLISFLDQVWSGWSYILLACIAIPALGLQEFATKMSEKLGVKTVAFTGLGLSGISLILMGIFASSNPNALIILSCAMVNSMGYACAMSLGQKWFLDTYNKIFAEHQWLKEIDSNASAGPMKILQNFANVIGLVFGGFILGVLDYRGFFIVFGLMILGALYWSVKNADSIEI